MPTSAPLTLHGNWQGYTASVLDLEDQRVMPLTLDAAGDSTLLEMAPVSGDALVVLKID
mgnify:CR=1 FL=1